MSTFPDVFIAAKSRATNAAPFLWLFEVKSPTGGPIYDLEGAFKVLRFTQNNEVIEYGVDGQGNSLIFDPWGVELSEVAEQSDGSTQGIELNISNYGLVDALARLNDSFRDHRLDMILVNAEALADPSAHFRIITKVREMERRLAGCSLLLSELSLLEYSVPKSLITRQCRFEYRKPGCDFIGDPDGVKLGPRCARTLSACEQRGEVEVEEGLATSLSDADHPRRFGGFPSLPAGGVRAVT